MTPLKRARKGSSERTVGGCGDDLSTLDFAEGSRSARTSRWRARLPFPAIGSGVAMTMLSTFAAADETALTRSAAAARSFDQPHTMAEIGLGLLTLPAASVCLPAGCSNGDTSLEANIWQMYRAGRFAVGAGATFAISPTTDSFRAQAGGFERTHARSYFLVEAQGRYYALSLDQVEAWIGVTAGGVIVSDRYSTANAPSGVAFIGPGASTVRTEGLTLGPLVGATWAFALNWSFGGTLRYSRWFLPRAPASTVFGDIATLTATQDVFAFGLCFEYRIAL
jgi:hypothetical protein